ncbi:hypothetical protein ACFYYR_07485 [Streptomyces sp. NPDC001922]|uniref:hypothetical protein n=1 Tax=Streptomyces sp. NPDC001922 TaxID=3364624 RepID=UPI003681FDB2
MPSRRTVSALVSVAMGLSLAGLGAGPASAADRVYIARDKHNTGWASFHSQADHFYLYDISANGHGELLQYYRPAVELPGDASEMHWAERYPAAVRHEDFKEGSTVKFRVCEQKGETGKPYNCGPWKTGKA